MNITIRLAEQYDESQVSELLSQITRVHYVIRPDIFRPDYTCEKSTITNDIEEPVFVAENERGDIVGGLWCIIKRERDNSLKVDRDWLIIDDICVDEKYRGNGIGTQLVDFACKLAKENGLNRIELNVYNDNQDAVRFYEKIGFSTQKRVMELDLLNTNEANKS